MRKLPPIPPALSQLTTVGPDGDPDTASRSDCGETCVAAAVRSFGGLALSPGCIREALGKPGSNGVTNSRDLCAAVDGLGLRSEAIEMLTGSPYKEEAERHLFKGKQLIVLGFWQGFVELHWVLAYGAHPQKLWVMDPWVGRYVSWHWEVAGRVATGPAVAVWKSR